MGESGSHDHPLMVDDESPSPPEQNESNEQSEESSSRWSYFKSGDFVELVCCTVFCVVASTCLLGTSARERPIPFQLLDSSGDRVLNLYLAEDLEDETISDALLVVLSVIIPFVIQMILTKAFYVKGDAHSTVCVYLIAVGINVVLMEFLKNYVGYLRPHFYADCQPDENFEQCTNNSSDKSRRSFPSGHASLSFCGLTLFSLYLLRRFGCYNSSCLVSVEERQEDGSTVVLLKYQKPPRYKRAVSLLCVSPILLAFFISASRIVDNFHFPADVVGGGVIGVGIAVFSHGLWFPSWSSL